MDHAKVKENAVRTVLRVRNSEIDCQGIVFNSRYLEYLDVGLVELIRARGIDLIATSASDYFDTALVKATIEYLAPAQLDQELAIWARLERIGTKSFTVSFAIERIEPYALLTKAELVYVNYSVARRIAMPIPDDIRAALTGTDKAR
jgi:acyl-CoA thioester hydrolase